MEPGTLYQLRNLLNRRNVTRKPKINVNAAEDFVEVVTIGHILSAVMRMLKMTSIDGIPSSDVVSQGIWMEDDSVRKKLLDDIATFIVHTHVDLATTFKVAETSGSSTVYSYACEALTLGLFMMDFKDAVREGDGDRVLSLWKYMFLLFKASNRKNYAIEAFTLLSQYYLLFPPNIAEQLKWSRFVNVHGLPGANISCDLHMEHLNRLVKVAIEGLGANKSEKAIRRASKALKVASEVTDSYDQEAKVPETSGKHADVSFTGDIEKVVEQLVECDTFNPSTCSTHASFSHLRTNLITTLDEDKVKDWMAEQFSKGLLPEIPNLIDYNDSSDDSD
jgi:L1 cell adhesion molecule like protein